MCVPQTTCHLWEYYLCLSKVDYGMKSETIAVTVQTYLQQWFNTLPISREQHRHHLFSGIWYFILILFMQIYTQWNSVSLWSTPDWNSFKGPPRWEIFEKTLLLLFLNDAHGLAQDSDIMHRTDCSTLLLRGVLLNLTCQKSSPYCLEMRLSASPVWLRLSAFNLSGYGSLSNASSKKNPKS